MAAIPSGCPFAGTQLFENNSAFGKSMSVITLDELKRQLDAGAPLTLVEVLAPHAYRKAHLPGAINLPILGLRRMAEAMLADKQAVIVVYCQNARCGSSAKAVRVLTELGYANVREFRDGKEAWIAAGYPIEGDAAPAGSLASPLERPAA
ncbi:MAG: sulfurtransferase [Candidatus Roseilinea sp.]|nr:MAG: sulfurtransferase [Candidatus Roseilinea sp.]